MQEVGTKGMIPLITTLRNDRRDVELAKAVLETLDTLCISEPSSATEKDATQKKGNDLGVMFTEIFIKSAENVTLLLDILEEHDFYVRFYTVKLLTTLLTNKPDQLQSCILTSPVGISRHVRVIITRDYSKRYDCPSHVVKHAVVTKHHDLEGLLLLISLTETNADIQKIIAFENAFERLLSIIRDEGATDGGIIAQDCLTLTQNLLRHNVSNQNYFRESSCIQLIPSLLISRVLSGDPPVAIEVTLTHEANSWQPQKVVNTGLILELIRILVMPNNPNTPMNQNVMNSVHLITPVLDLAMSQTIPTKVKAQALYTLADMIRGNPANQDLFGKSTVQPSSPAFDNSQQMRNGKPPSKGLPQPALVSVVLIALSNTKDEFSLRTASAYLFQCYLHNNTEGQVVVASTLTPPPQDNPNSQLADKPASVGSLLLAALFDWDTSAKDPFRCWFAAMMLSQIIRRNPKSQEMALAIKFNEASGDESISLLHRCTYSLLMAHRNGADVRVQVGFLCLLAIWMYECPPAVNEFLAEGSNLQVLIEQISKSSGLDPLVQGVAAFVLGMCFEHNDDSEPAFTKLKLHQIVSSRIGTDLFVSRLERLRESKAFNRASPYMQTLNEVDTRGFPELYFDYSFVDFFKTNYETISRAITATRSKASPKKDTILDEGDESAIIKSYKVLISKQDAELHELRKRVAELEVRLAGEAALRERVDVLNATVQKLQVSNAEMTRKYANLDKEHEDLLVCLAEQDMQQKELRQRLKTHGEVIEDDDDDDDDDEGGDGTNGIA
ncbi:hypothetical protein SmJEL517_g00638 [Synchytrium microbalum]|uniref:Vesicle tethering protein Uso1/P115-like head domain-containing protein n=1 Tax=Synchytrium microbalum TaxID=1806994 RepID=A0A507C903_9FUNG|nr:uncharacterized protein SmJEL517_g00638 [Synchytrium microbalum]TPX37537.1 hypothetical protein SmJEL517_g00638 [Synchytrium microbalum]